MPQSLSNILLHIVFPTKDRFPYLTDDLTPDLHAYLTSTSRQLDCECYRVGGVADHVHLAIHLPRTLTVAKLVETLKSSSSKWLKDQSPRLSKFAWQSGYGAFSVSPTQLSKLTDYIERQKERHRTVTFQDEYRSLLKKNSASISTSGTYGTSCDQPRICQAFSPLVPYSSTIPGLQPGLVCIRPSALFFILHPSLAFPSKTQKRPEFHPGVFEN